MTIVPFMRALNRDPRMEHVIGKPPPSLSVFHKDGDLFLLRLEGGRPVLWLTLDDDGTIAIFGPHDEALFKDVEFCKRILAAPSETKERRG